jgi:hypothetical protein
MVEGSPGSIYLYFLNNTLLIHERCNNFLCEQPTTNNPCLLSPRYKTPITFCKLRSRPLLVPRRLPIPTKHKYINTFHSFSNMKFSTENNIGRRRGTPRKQGLVLNHKSILVLVGLCATVRYFAALRRVNRRHLVTNNGGCFNLLVHCL